MSEIKIPTSVIELGRVTQNRCPYCGGDNTEGFSVETGNGEASQEMQCNDCDAQWLEIYGIKQVVRCENE